MSKGRSLGFAVGAVLLMLLACAPKAPAGRSQIAALSTGLDAVHGSSSSSDSRHRMALLYDALVKDRPWCAPKLDSVFEPPAEGMSERLIVGQIPHYDWYFGPVHYRIGVERSVPGKRPSWLVRLNVALEPPAGQVLELPDCGLGSALDGPVVCEGTPYEQAEGLHACPDTGTFRAPLTRRNLRALAARWSTDIERYYNRDAKRYGIPVRYDFHFFLVDDASSSRRPVDLRVELAATCARTPYFRALRSGWSIPVLAHEIGHYLGLLDEYEALSGVTSLYPKTPFAGSEKSRMGVSMKPGTRLWPLHHYLVLRRYHCANTVPSDVASQVLMQ